jgi:glutamate-5-semialdehyde dehydrogenase
VGEVIDGWVRPNGLRISRVRVPLGVVAIIYENRPNVTSDAAGLCLKSGNAAFLRGSSGAISSNLAIAGRAARGGREGRAARRQRRDGRRHQPRVGRRVHASCAGRRLPDPPGRPVAHPAILDNATVPYVIDGDGNCHVYVDAGADLDMARDIVVNAKTQRPSVCNAAESLVVHAAVADHFLPQLAEALAGVELVGDERARALVPTIGRGHRGGLGTEFLDLKMSVRVVDTLDEAIEPRQHLQLGPQRGHRHHRRAPADRFVAEVDAAAVLVNASTRFVDGEEFGFGAEIGISTQKLHARGPMGLRQLTTAKYVVRGDGQTRG